MASSSHTLPDHDQQTDPSSSPEDVGVTQDIFLSHSGQQKLFVEYLFSDLTRANRTAFFDKRTLRKASPFPPAIMRAVGGCKLGVIVLSNEFMTSKWPMMELEMMVKRKIDLFPLFYSLSPADLKCPRNLSEWKTAWEGLVDKNNENQAKRWEEAVRKLRAYNGEVLKKDGDEFDYIEKVVKAICTLVPPRATYNLSSIEGHQRMVKEIEKHFSHVEDARRCKGACMVGLYGVAGLGKTTLCKTMVNHHTFLDIQRSCLITFPTDGDKLEIVRACKVALKELSNLSDRGLEGIDSFDQVIQRMKEHGTTYDVFLAIDNVWPESAEEAEGLLGVGFTANSKILLTSRSEQVLQNVLSCHKDNSYIASLPSPQQEDAIKIFQNNRNLSDLTSQFREQIEKYVELCRFDGKYHPLALKALGKHTGSLLFEPGEPETIARDLSCILEDIDRSGLQEVNDAVKLNYGGLSSDMKEMFLDIALWMPQMVMGDYQYRRTIANAVQWLRFFFDESYSKLHIKKMIHDLAVAGVIQIESDKFGDKTIGLHDLYAELARKEATSTGFSTSTEEPMERMMCGSLKRLFLKGVTGDKCMKKVLQSELPRLQLLYAHDIRIWKRIHSKTMPALRVLSLEQPRRRSGILGNVLTRFDKINLEGLVQLRFLTLRDCDFVTSFEGLIALCNLQMLDIISCRRLENVNGLGSLPQLEALRVEWCGALKKLPDLGGVTCLEMLKLTANRSLEEVSGRLSPALKVLRVELCGALKKLPDLGGVTGLERLDLNANRSLEEVIGRLISPALKVLRVGWCEALKKLPDLGGVTGLERLLLYWNDSLEKVSGRLSPALKELAIEFCGALTKLPDLGGVTGLEKLELRWNKSLEDVGGRLSHALKERKMTDLGGSTWLEKLTRCGNDSSEEVALASLSFAPKISKFVIYECPLLTSSNVIELRSHDWNGRYILSKVQVLLYHNLIHYLKIEECGGRVVKVESLTHLRRLEVRKCGELEWIEGLDGLQMLEEVVLYECGRLKDRNGSVRALGRRTNLKLRIESCPHLSVGE